MILRAFKSNRFFLKNALTLFSLFLQFQIPTLFLAMAFTLVTWAITWMQAVTDSISWWMITKTMPFMF